MCRRKAGGMGDGVKGVGGVGGGTGGPWEPPHGAPTSRLINPIKSRESMEEGGLSSSSSLCFAVRTTGSAVIHVKRRQLHLLRLDRPVVFIPQQVVGTRGGDRAGRDVRPRQDNRTRRRGQWRGEVHGGILMGVFIL